MVISNENNFSYRGIRFIGSHTCVSLINNNFNVYIIDSLTNSKEENLFSIKKICKLSDSSSKGKLLL